VFLCDQPFPFYLGSYPSPSFSCSSSPKRKSRFCSNSAYRRLRHLAHKGDNMFAPLIPLTRAPPVIWKETTGFFSGATPLILFAKSVFTRFSQPFGPPNCLPPLSWLVRFLHPRRILKSLTGLFGGFSALSFFFSQCTSGVRVPRSFPVSGDPPPFIPENGLLFSFGLFDLPLLRPLHLPLSGSIYFH